MQKLILASNNKNKLREITDLLRQNGFPGLILEPIGAYTTEEPVEDGGSYLANATIKALAAARLTGLPCLAEDSGIAVAALDGVPNVETAPWVAGVGGWHAAMALVQAQVAAGKSDRIGFSSTFVLAWPDGTLIDADATCAGRFTWPPRGADGFGHDPYFIPYTEGHSQERTYAEMGLAEKQQISPRAMALKKLTTKLLAILNEHDREPRPATGEKRLDRPA